jgi:hypothetical protein
MTLVFQVLGFLAGGMALVRLLAQGAPRLTRYPLAGVGMVVALVGGVLFWGHIWQIGSGLPESTRTASLVSSFAAQHEADPGANNAFLEWARKEMLGVAGSRGTYYLEPAKVLADPLLSLWSTYELLPERETSKLSEAEWIVFYEAGPHLAIKQGRPLEKIFHYSSGYALALKSNAR